MASTPRRREHASSFTSVPIAVVGPSNLSRKKEAATSDFLIREIQHILQYRVSWFFIGILAVILLRTIILIGYVSFAHEAMTMDEAMAMDEALAMNQAMAMDQAAVGIDGVLVIQNGGVKKATNEEEAEEGVVILGEEGNVKILDRSPWTRPTFILFGDSLTERSFEVGGWGAALANRYIRKVDILCRGYSGYNSRWGMYLLPRVFPYGNRYGGRFGSEGEEGPLLVTVFFGANDAALPDRSNKRQHVPLIEYQQNLRMMVRHLIRLSDKTRVVLITAPPIHEESRLAFAKEKYGLLATTLCERTNDVAKLYADACKAVADEMMTESNGRVGVVDLWSAIQKVPDWGDTCLSDGLHFTPAGNDVLFKELVAVLNSMGGEPSLHPDKLLIDFPLHADIDSEDPARTLGEL